MEKKWYVIHQSAEDDSYYVIELNNAFAINFRYVLNHMELITGGNWSGFTYMYPDGFNTREAAVDFIMEQVYGDYKDYRISY